MLNIFKTENVFIIFQIFLYFYKRIKQNIQYLRILLIKNGLYNLILLHLLYYDMYLHMVLQLTNSIRNILQNALTGERGRLKLALVILEFLLCVEEFTVMVIVEMRKSYTSFVHLHFFWLCIHYYFVKIIPRILCLFILRFNLVSATLKAR